MLSGAGRGLDGEGRPRRALTLFLAHYVKVLGIQSYDYFSRLLSPPSL